MAPVKEPFLLAVHVMMMMMVVVVIHSTGLCGCNRQRNGGKCSQDESELLHSVSPMG
jgi:hypothetical protein